jgi:hypothetical protein
VIFWPVRSARRRSSASRLKLRSSVPSLAPMSTINWSGRSSPPDVIGEVGEVPPQLGRVARRVRVVRGEDLVAVGDHPQLDQRAVADSGAGRAGSASRPACSRQGASRRSAGLTPATGPARATPSRRGSASRYSWVLAHDGTAAASGIARHISIVRSRPSLRFDGRLPAQKRFALAGSELR